MKYTIILILAALTRGQQGSLPPIATRQRGNGELTAMVQVCIIIPTRIAFTTDSVSIDSTVKNNTTLKYDAIRADRDSNKTARKKEE